MSNPARFPRCRCLAPRCKCAGGIHSFAQPYRRLLERVAPRIVVEWGPGVSTRVALAQPTVERVLSIEHNPKWLPQIDDARWKVRMARFWAREYVEPRELEQADVIFVDARRRARCLEQAYEYARPGAAVCLHDAQRKRYQRALARFDRVEFVEFGFAVAVRGG